MGGGVRGRFRGGNAGTGAAGDLSQLSGGGGWVAMFIAVCLVAINLRMSISGVGPLVGDIAADLGIPAGSLGMLASLPLLVWAGCSPLAHGLAGWLGLDRSVTWSLLVLLGGTVLRSVSGFSGNLWFGTVLVGAALAVMNVLLPAVIKRDFGARLALVMGVYSALIGVSGAVGSAIVGPVAAVRVGGAQLGWQGALLATGFSVPLAFVVWWFVTRRAAVRRAGAVSAGEGAAVAERAESGADGAAPAAGAVASTVSGMRVSPGKRSVGSLIWGDGVAWLIAVYMGSQSWVFYIMATWYPSIEASHGADAISAGLHVTYFHSCGIVGSLLAPFLLRGAGRRLFPLVLPVLNIVGSVCVVVFPGALLLWYTICGLCVGASLSVALTFVGARSGDAVTARAVSGMSQSIGYLVAAAGPVLFGFVHQLVGGWVVPLFVLVFGALLQLAAGVGLLRDRMVLQRYQLFSY